MTLFHGLGHVASGRLRSRPGMVLLTPTSIAHSGTSASIGANGQVTFTAVTSLSLNGVFSATYDNYLLSLRLTVSMAEGSLYARLRTSGSDASGSNYVRQWINADGTGVSAARNTSQTQISPGYFASTVAGGLTMAIYGPNLAQPTAFRTVLSSGVRSAYIEDEAATHSLSTSYDGITLYPQSGNITGAVQVYGVRS